MTDRYTDALFPTDRYLMNFIRLACYVFSAGAMLGGCISWIPGSVKYQISQAGSGDAYALVCMESSSGTCHIRIDGPGGKASHAVVPAGSTQKLHDAVSGASFCVSSSTPGELTCKGMRQTFGPGGSVVQVSSL